MAYCPFIFYFLCVEGGGFGDGLVVMVVLVVEVVLVDVKVSVGSAVAIVVRILYVILFWLVVLVYHLPGPAVCSDGFDCRSKYSSVVAGCCRDSWFSQNCVNLQMS